MRSIAISHPNLGFGGSEITALWMLQSLQDEYDLTLLTGNTVEWERLNAFCGTRVLPERIRVLIAPMPGWLKRGGAGDAMRGAFFQRFCRYLGPRFDLCISAYNIVDFGSPAIQFIADLSWTEPLRKGDLWSPSGLRSLVSRDGLIRRLYLATAHLVGGASKVPRAPGSLVASNSKWIASKIESAYGLHTEVIYPPVSTGTRLDLNLHHLRTNDFVLLGRIAPEKRVVDAIGILQRVRERGHDVKLHILGTLDDSAYVRHTRAAAQGAGPWVILPGGVYGLEKTEYLLSHGYGLHLCSEEAFGIAVAEEMQMGMIPFVPSEGGPAEIVAHPRLAFQSDHDAVGKIVAVLRDSHLQEELRTYLKSRAEQYSAERFVTEFRSLVDRWFSGDAKISREHPE